MPTPEEQARHKLVQVGNRHERTPTWSEEEAESRWRASSHDELMARDKLNLDIFWLWAESLEDTAEVILGLFRTRSGQ